MKKISLLIFLICFNFISYLGYTQKLISGSEAVRVINDIEAEFLEYSGQKTLIKPIFRQTVVKAKNDLINKAQVTNHEVNKWISQILSASGDTHSRMRFSRMSSFDHFLDFNINTTVINSNRVFVATDLFNYYLLDSHYPFITHINNIKIEDIISKTGPQIHSGSSDSLYYSRSTAYIKNWGFYFGTDANEVELTLKSKEGKISKVKRPIIKKIFSGEALPQGRTPKIFQNNIGYFRIDSMRTSSKLIKSWHDFMGRAKDTKGLIIDLRGNQGGDRLFFKEFFPYFMKEKYMIATAGYCINNEECFQGANAREMFLASDIQSVSAREFITSHQLPKKDNLIGPFYHLIDKDLTHESYTYTKPVIVLIDIHNFSAADAFLGGIKELRQIITMGTPTSGGSGGPKHDSAFGDYTISQMLSVNPNGSVIEGHSHQPDILVYPEVTFFSGETDRILELAQKHILR